MHWSFSLVLLFLSLVACQKKGIKSNEFQQIRFENINANGDLVSSLSLKDNFEKYSTNNEFEIQAVKKAKFPQNRIKILFVGDGYNSNEQEKFSEDVKLQISRFLSQEPFKAFQNYFFFESVAQISEDSGVSQSEQITKKTFFEMHYGCSGIDRLLCINTEKLMKVIDPNDPPHMTFALANDSKYGGAGYMSPAVATLAAQNSLSSELAFHEFGHAFGQLADEYDDSGVDTNCTQFANTSANNEAKMMRKKEKWYRWLDLENIGAFQGSCYSKNYYRPSESSKMRKLGQSFEAVNIEQLIFKIYEKLKLVESSIPIGTYNEHLRLWLKTLEPSETPLNITWKVNGVLKSEFSNLTAVDSKNLNLRRGKNKIEVTVRDPTIRVRNEKLRSQLMTQTLKWNINLP